MQTMYTYTHVIIAKLKLVLLPIFFYSAENEPAHIIYD